MFERFDSIIGKTIGSSSKGTFVELIGGQIGWIGRIQLPRDLSVICTIYKIKEDNFPILKLDSVIYADAA